jgi:5,5'-dehydrodivanillate O-demethylase
MTATDGQSELVETKAGTPGGDMLRRSWHPIAVVDQLPDEYPIRPVRVLSEGLALFRDRTGRVGLIQERCTHHGVLLAYGRVNEEALICPLHDWHFDVAGNCWAQGYQSKKFEMPWSNARTYPVAEYGGLFWAYLGSSPAPTLPAYDLLDRTDGRLRITVHPRLEANWAAVEPPPADGALWLRTPVDDSHTWQVAVESVDGKVPYAEVVYVDEADGEPFRGLTGTRSWWMSGESTG